MKAPVAVATWSKKDPLNPPIGGGEGERIVFRFPFSPFRSLSERLLLANAKQDGTTQCDAIFILYTLRRGVLSVLSPQFVFFIYHSRSYEHNEK